jgi:GxxExxY protein
MKVMEPNKITEMIIGAAIEVHRHLGPGLFESTYQECLTQEMTLLGLNFEREKPLPLE